MRDDKDEPSPGASRRRFLEAAGLAAAGVSALAVRPAWAFTDGRRIGEAGSLEADCECGAQPSLPLLAAALYHGGYVGLAATKTGPGLFSLDVDSALRVSLGAPLDVSLPRDFKFGSLGVRGGRLVVTGGLPFLWSSYEADDELDPLVRDFMDDLPPGAPTTGTRRIDVMGVRPAVFLADLPYTEALELPELPRRLFAVATAVAETRGGLALLVEHSDDLTESWYAAAVDVLEQRGGGWTVRPAGRELGESGPNHLAADGGDLVVGLKTSRDLSFVWPARRGARAAAPSDARRIIGVVPGDGEVELIAADGHGNTRRWSLAQGRWSDRGPLRVAGDEIVGALAVAGTKGQSIVLGREGALLVDESLALVGRRQGGEHHVL